MDAAPNSPPLPPMIGNGGLMSASLRAPGVIPFLVIALSLWLSEVAAGEPGPANHRGSAPAALGAP
jgi:hypothetical protein